MTSRKPTGIRGLDAILGGGIPADRATLVLGGPGAGKTVLAMQMLANAAISGNERGLFVSFEESPEDLVGHLQGFGWGLPRLVAEPRGRFLPRRGLPMGKCWRRSAISAGP